MTSPALFPLRLLGLPLVPTAGDWNMAADEWLLVRAVEAQEAALRFYAWDRATVSLGHFQQVEALPSHLATLPVVRRLSGGGAIIHDAELTYSLVLPVTHPLAAQPQRLYGLVHSAILDALATLGVAIEFRGATNSDLADRYLCFGRGDSFDLVVPASDGPNKVVGSTQRRRKGAVLQHGSLLLRASPHAPEFPGLFDLRGFEIDLQPLANLLLTPLLAALGPATEATEFLPEEQKEIAARAGSYRLAPAR